MYRGKNTFEVMYTREQVQYKGEQIMGPLLCLENFTFVSYGISDCFHMFLCAKFDVMILLHWLCWLTKGDRRGRMVAGLKTTYEIISYQH
jgi:hypothetical protein